MLDALRFVQGAVARKDILPELTHFRIENGTIIGYNGRMALCSPIGLDFNVTPNAEQMMRAIRACTDTVAFHMTKAGRLAIKSGRYRAYIDCLPDVSSWGEPEGARLPITTGFLDRLAAVAPFIAQDASRQWAQGVLFAGGALYATNNVVLVGAYTGTTFPRPLNIPRQAVLELLRIGEEPVEAQLTDTSITFHWQGGRWLRTQLYSIEWPCVDQMLAQPITDPYTLPEGFFAAVRSVAPFVNELGSIYLTEQGISTAPGSEEGAHVDLAAFPPVIFNVEHLLLLEGVADTIELSAHPRPCRFRGKLVEGMIMGMTK